MTIQTLVAALKQNIEELPVKMNLGTDAIIINQCDEHSYTEFTFGDSIIKGYNLKDRGVGMSRNGALLRATADIVLFSDEDIVYQDGYGEKIIKEFEERPWADVLVFNIDVTEERRTYYTNKEHRVHLYNCGRYPTYSFACRRSKLIKNNITFNLLFGGGAPYSNGEDSLFIQECIKKGLKVVALPVSIGKEEPRPSTWFNGYNEKFFYDRGILYRFLYGKLATLMGIRFVMKNRGVMCKEIDYKSALALLKKGIREAGNI